DGGLQSDWPPSISLGPNPNAVDSSATLLEVNAHPAIAYTQGINADTLLYALATTASGGLPGDWSSFTLTSRGGIASPLVVNGKPAIGFLSLADAAAEYVQANNVDGGSLANWPAPVTVDLQATAVGTHCRLVVVQGKPVLIYLQG